MGKNELCPECTKRGDGRCLYEDAIKLMPLNNVTKTVIGEHKTYAQERKCTRIVKVAAFLHGAREALTPENNFPKEKQSK